MENLTEKVKNDLSKDSYFLKRFAAHLKISHGALVCRGTQFENHWIRRTKALATKAIYGIKMLLYKDNGKSESNQNKVKIVVLLTRVF